MEAILNALAKSPPISRIYLLPPNPPSPALSAELLSYIPSRAFFFSDPGRPSIHEAEEKLRRLSFFSKFANSELHISPIRSNMYVFNIEITGLKGAVLKDEKDIENLDGSLSLSPNFNDDGINLDWRTRGEYVPMPFGIRPKRKNIKTCL